MLDAARLGDKDASEEMIRQNSGLIWSVARRFFGRGAEPDDLYQLGCIGFIKAISGFDPEYGTQFSTYAVPAILGEMKRIFRDGGAVKVSRSIKERSREIWAEKEKLENEKGEWLKRVEAGYYDEADEEELKAVLSEMQV